MDMKVLLELTVDQLNVVRSLIKTSEAKISKENLEDLKYALLDKITNKNPKTYGI